MQQGKWGVAAGAVLLLCFFAMGEETCPLPEGIPIRGIMWQGLNHTRLEVVRQEMRQHAGGRFSCAVWKREKGRLKDLGVFADISLSGDGWTDSVTLVYRFREFPPIIPMITVNNTDQDGFSIGPHVALTNFLGTAKKIHLMARFLGTEEYKVAVSGRQLGHRPVEFELAWVYVDSYNPFADFHEKSHSLQAMGFWPFGEMRHLGWVGYGETFWIASDSVQGTLRPAGDFVPRLGSGIRVDFRDRALLPRRGLFSEWRVTQNGGPLGGPANFTEGLWDLRGYMPVTPRQGLSANALYQYRGGPSLGRYDRFHVGGANTLRGFPQNTLQGRNECLLNFQYGFDALPERLQSWRTWTVNYSMQWVAGLDAATHCME
jgi:outer membrane protein assembly factor BamA